MPELGIVADDGSLLPTAPIVLLAISIYPKDERSRTHLAADLLMRWLKPSGDLSGLAFLLPMLHRAPAANELLRNAAQAGGRANFASNTLLIMLCAAEFHPDLEVNASIAAHAVEQITRAVSERTKWRIWGHYKSAAHLRLAIETVLEEQPADSPSIGRYFFDQTQRVLDLSESIRLYAEKHRILKRGTTWKVPPSIPTARVLLPLKPLSDVTLAAIRSYEPPHSRKA